MDKILKFILPRTYKRLKELERAKKEYERLLGELQKAYEHLQEKED